MEVKEITPYGNGKVLVPTKITPPAPTAKIPRNYQANYHLTISPNQGRLRNTTPGFYHKEYFYSKFSYFFLLALTLSYCVFLVIHTIAVFVSPFYSQVQMIIWSKSWGWLVFLWLIWSGAVLLLVFKGIDLVHFKEEYKVNQQWFSSLPTVWVKKKYQKMVINQINYNWFFGSSYLLILLVIFFVFLYLYIYNSWHTSGQAAWPYTRNFLSVQFKANNGMSSTVDLQQYGETNKRNFIIFLGVFGICALAFHVWNLAFFRARLNRLEAFYQGLYNIIAPEQMENKIRHVKRRNLFIFLVVFASLAFILYKLIRRKQLSKS